MSYPTKAPTEAEAIQATRQQIRQWLVTNSQAYARQAARSQGGWFDASVACRDTMLGALATLELSWREDDNATGKM